jgi:hypothetical protein
MLLDLLSYIAKAIILISLIGIVFSKDSGLRNINKGEKQ